MGKKKTYLVDGNPVIVEDKDNEAFLKEVPNAQEAKAFLVGSDSVAVAPQDLDAFLKEVPDAKPLFEDEEVKKKSSASSGSGVPTDGEKNPYAPNTEIDYSPLRKEGLAKKLGVKVSNEKTDLGLPAQKIVEDPFVAGMKPKAHVETSVLNKLMPNAAALAEKERKASVLVNQFKKEPVPKGYKPDDVGMETYVEATKAHMAEQNADIEKFIQPELQKLQQQYTDLRESDVKYQEAMAPIKQQIDAYSQELTAKAQKVVMDNHITDPAKLEEMSGELNKAVNEYAKKLMDASPALKERNDFYNDAIGTDLDVFVKNNYKPKTKYFGNGEPIEPFISAIKSESFSILSQNEKKAIIASMWDKLNTRMQQKDIPQKTIDEAKQEFMWYAMDAATHNENGGISQFALREMATKMKPIIEEQAKNLHELRRKYYEQTLTPEELKWYTEHGDSEEKVKNSLSNVDAVLSTPDGDINKWLAFGKGFASEAGLPFIKSLNEISTGLDTYKISQKMLKKQPLTPEEATYMKTVGMADAIRAEMPKNAAYNIGAGLAGSMVFLGEFAALNPVGAIVEEGSANALRLGLKGAGNKVKQAAYKEAIATQLAQAPIKFTKPLLYEALVVKPLSTIIGATAQTLASPNQVINNTIRRMTPQALVMFSPEVNDLVTQLNTEKFNIEGYRTGHNEPLSEALPRGFAQAFTEIFTEKMFSGLGGVSDLATRGLMTRLMKDIPTAQKMFVAYMMSKYKLRVDQVDDFLKNSGLPVGGFIEEFAEEGGSAALQPWLTGDGRPLGDWYDPEKGMNWRTLGETGGIIIAQNVLFRGLGAAATLGQGGYVNIRVTDGQTPYGTPISEKGFTFISSSLKDKDKEYIKAWAATHITSFSEKEQLAVKALINHLAKEKIFQTHKGKIVPDIFGAGQQAAPPPPGQQPPPNTPPPPPPTPEQQAAEDFDIKERNRGNTGYTIQHQDGTIETPDAQELLEWLAVPANLRRLEQGQSTLNADNPSDEVSAVLVEFAKHGSAIAVPEGAITAEKHNGKYVKYKGELGIIHVDEGGKITVETPDKIYDIQGNVTDDLTEHGIEPINARPAGSATQAPPAPEAPAGPAGPAAEVGSDEAIATDAERLRGTAEGETLSADFANEQDPYEALSRAYHQAMGVPIAKRTKLQHRLIAGVEDAFSEKDKAPDPPSDKIEVNAIDEGVAVGDGLDYVRNKFSEIESGGKQLSDKESKILNKEVDKLIERAEKENGVKRNELKQATWKTNDGYTITEFFENGSGGTRIITPKGEEINLFDNKYKGESGQRISYFPKAHKAQSTENENNQSGDNGEGVEIGTTDNTNTILEKAEKKGGIYSELAKAIKGALANVKTIVTDAFKSDVSTEADYGDNEIRINAKSKYNKLHLFFHEGVHHITREKIEEFERNPNSKNLKPHEIEAIIDLKRIFKKVTEELNKQEGGFGTKKGGQSPTNMWVLDATGNKRGLENVHEFISEAFTNPEFQKILKGFKGEGKTPNIFKQFLDAVAKMLGLKDATILDDIFYHTENLIENNPSNAKAKIGKQVDVKELDASYILTPIAITDPMYKQGFRYEGKFGYPESLGEQGNYSDNNLYKEIPTEQKVIADIKSTLQYELDQLNEQGNLSARDENIKDALEKALNKLENENNQSGNRISHFKVGDIITRDGNKYEILGNSKKQNTGVVKLRNIESGVVSPWNAEGNGGFKLVDGQGQKEEVKSPTEEDVDGGVKAIGSYNPKFKTAKKVIGEEATIEMPNGETREAEYMVVESDDILASHNEISFNDTEGFPKTKDGRNANSRNYKGDKSAQLKVNDDAANLKSSIVISDAATPDTGVPIISEDGIVLSGNGRTMAIKLSQNIAPEKYQAYKADLVKRAAKFGIDPNEVAKMKKPILVKVDKSVKDYSVKTFDEYNGKSQKEESPIDKAIKRSAIIQNDENLKERILSVIGRHETMSDLFENKADRKELFDLLVANNIILKQETPKYVQQSGEFTNDGKDLINDVLIATILSPETLEATNNVKAFRNKIINALPVLSVNYKLGNNSLEAEVNDAIMLQSRIAAMGSQDDFWKHLRQMGMFDVVNPNTVIINRMINNGAKDFKKFVVSYNKSMEIDENNLFGGDVVLTKQQIIDNLKESNLSENEKQIIANLEELYDANEQKGPIGNGDVVGGNEEQDDKGEADKPDEKVGTPPPAPPKPPTPPGEKRKIERKIRDAKDQKDIDDALDDLFKPTGPKLTMGGIDPDKLAKAIKVVGMYMKKGVHKFSDIIEDAYAKYGDAVTEIFDALKAAYLAYLNVQATDAEAAQMDTNLRGVTLDSIINTDNNDDNRPGDSAADSPNPKDAKPDNEEIISGNGGKGAGGRGGNSNGGKESKGGKGSSDIRPPSSGEQGDNQVDKPDGTGRDAGNDAGGVDGRGNDIGGRGGHGAANGGGKGPSNTGAKSFAEKLKQQREVDNAEVKISDMANIEETLPFLLPEQQHDVKKAEDRFFGESHKTKEQAFGKGMLFTNGTGTGKTYTGLGIIKRFINSGKKKVLIVVPSSMKASDWREDGKNLGLDIHVLADTKDAGKAVSVTTYANFRANQAIYNNDYDLVVYDESHRLMEDKGGNASSTTYTHYELSNKSEKDAFARLTKYHPLWVKRKELQDKIRELNKQANHLDLMDLQHHALLHRAEQHEKELESVTAKIDAATPALKDRAKKAYENTKVVFLSATPFKFHFNLRYANGFLFDWGEETQMNNRGSRVDAESRFYLEKFGSAYEWKYHRLQAKFLANPDAIAMQEVAFADNLMKNGAMSGRAIDSPQDYSREFPVVSGFKSEEFNRAFGEIFSYEDRQFDMLASAARKVFFNYNYTTQLFEALKTSAALPRIQQHLDLGRKVVIFHRRQQANSTPPFKTILNRTRSDANVILKDPDIAPKERENAQKALYQADEFEAKYHDLLAYEQTLNYDSAVDQITRAFPGQVKIVNGNVTGKDKNAAVKDFNTDGGKTNILVIQEEAGKEGISLHDTTGKNPRVLMSLSMPISTTTALQVEGRIFRIGQQSNAIFEYPLLGLDLEIAYFGNNLNKRLSTTENLALGTNSRDLIRSYSEGVLNNSTTDAPHAGQGEGGKEYDKKTQEQLTPFGKAKLIYATNQKTTGTRNQRQGVDFYPTPEPLGQKMVEWADMRYGEHALEPSAGMGAIAMWVPNTNSITAIEPSFDLYSKLTARAGGSTQRVINGNFEDHAAQNKYETIVMNPPFGQAGSTAMQHVKKAFSHLREGGRMVAIVPVGNMDKLMANWLNETDDKGNLVNGNAKFVATIQLPSSTFAQAGTSVNTRVVIIDKVRGGNNNIQSEDVVDGRADLAELADSNIDLRSAKNIGELFDAIENLSIPARTVPEVAQQAPIENNEEAPKPSEDDVVSGVTEYKHTVTGDTLYKVTTLRRMGDAWKGVNQSAVSHKGKYSPFAKGWLFVNKADAEAFVAKQNGSPAMGAGGTNQNIHAQDYDSKRAQAKTAYEKELEQALEVLSKAYAEARGNDAALRKLTETTPKTVRGFIKRLLQGTTPESVADRKAALVEIQRMYAKEKAEMRAGVPRERGANFIIEKLSRAARNGDITQEAADLAIDLVRMSPEMFQDLAISITQNDGGNEGSQGWYRSADALVKIFKNPADPTTAAHELLHHTERFMPYDVRVKILEEWQKEVDLQIAHFKGLLKSETDATKRDFYSKAIMYLALAQERSLERNYQNAEDMKSIMLKYLSDHTDSQGKFHQGLGQSFYQVFDASEWWAVNASQLMQEAKNKPELKTWIDKAKAFLNGLIKAAKKIFKGSPTQAVEDGIKAIMDGRMLKNREGGMLADSGLKIGSYSNISAGSGVGDKEVKYPEIGGDNVDEVRDSYQPKSNEQSDPTRDYGAEYTQWEKDQLPRYAKTMQSMVDDYIRNYQYLSYDELDNLRTAFSDMRKYNYKGVPQSLIDVAHAILVQTGYYKYSNPTVQKGNKEQAARLINETRKQEGIVTPAQQMADAKAELARAWNASGLKYDKNAGQNLGFMYDPAVDIKRQGDLFKALYNVAKLAIQQAANKLLAINARDFIASIRGYGKLYADITDAHLTDVFNEAKKAFDAKEKDQSLVDPQMSQRTPNRAALAHDLVERVKTIYAKFGVPIAEQKLKKVRGFFQTHPEIVKISSMFNVAVGAHELMHYIIKKHAMVKQALSGSTVVSNQLKEIYVNHYPGAKDTHAEELQIEEGMTMLVNLWVQNPVYAQQMYGDAYYAMFDPAGSLYNNDVHDMALDFAEIIEDFLGLPANERIGARIRWGQPGVKKRTLHHNAYNVIKYQIYDKLYLAKDVDRMLGNEFKGSGIAPNIAMMRTAKTRMQHWFVRSRLANTRPQTPGKDGNWKEARYNTTVSDYMDLFHDKKSGLTIEEFNQMLVARRQLSDYKRLDKIDADVAAAKKMIETLEIDNTALEAQIAVETDKAILQSLKVQLSANLQNIQNYIDNITELTEDANKTSDILERNRMSRPFAEEVMALLGQRYAEPARMFDEVQANIVDMMEATGMVSAERANEWRSKDGYASFRRYFDNEEKLRETLVDAVGAKGVKQLTSLFPYKGSDLPLLPATYSQALAINEVMMKGSRNMMWQAWAIAASKNSDVAKMFRQRTSSETDKTDNIVVWMDGKQHFYQASAEVILFANAIENIQPDKFEEVGRAIAKMLQVSVTGIYLPFALVNLSVDAATRFQLSETGAIPVAHDIRTIYHMLESPVKILVGQILGKEFDPNIIDQYISMGGKASLNINLHNISAEGVMKQFLSPTALDKAKLAADASVEALSLAVNLTELMGRATEYRRAIAQGKPTNVAMMMAQNSAIDWNQRGNFGNTKGGHSMVTKLFNTIAYAFAQVTAFNQVVAGVKRHPVKSTALFTLITAVYAATQYLIYAWGDDDEKREMANQPVEMLPKFIYLPNSKLFGPESSGLTKIRVPELMGDMGSHFALGARSAYLGGLKGVNTTPKDVAYFSWKTEEQLVAGVLPPMMYPNPFVTKVGQDGRTKYPRMSAFISSLIPTAGKTEVEVVNGMKTYPTEMPIIPNYMSTWQAKYQYDKYTTETAKYLASVFDWSPKTLDYYITQKTGRGVKMIIEVGEYALGKKDELDLYNPTQVNDRFFFSGELSNSFYDKANVAINDNKGKLNDLSLTRENASPADLYTAGMAVLSQVSKATMTKTTKQIDAIQSYMDKMEGSPKLTEQDKIKLKRGELTQEQKSAIFNVWAASYNDDMLALRLAIKALRALVKADPLFKVKYEQQYFINASPEDIEKR